MFQLAYLEKVRQGHYQKVIIYFHHKSHTLVWVKILFRNLINLILNYKGAEEWSNLTLMWAHLLVSWILIKPLASSTRWTNGAWFFLVFFLVCHRQTDSQTARQTDRQTDRQTRQTRQTESDAYETTVHMHRWAKKNYVIRKVWFSRTNSYIMNIMAAQPNQ